MKKLPWILWSMVGLMAAWWTFNHFRRPVADPAEVTPVDGRVFVEVPWKMLPAVPRFELTERSGRAFDSAEMEGKVYAINIFFASCPTICRDFNTRIKSLSEKHADKEDLVFVSITCDPERDSPEVLQKYADSFMANDERWLFLTGSLHDIKQLGEHSLRVVVDPSNHTDDIMLVDRWGRYRDRFKWNDPLDLERFDQVLEELLAETEPPLDKTIRTRNVLAGDAAYNPESIPFLPDFRLQSATGDSFKSRMMTGKVWIASLFFTRCPTICPQMNDKLLQHQDRMIAAGIECVSITSDPENDTPPVLRTYAKNLGADEANWHFLTGEKGYIDRVAGEFLGAHNHGAHHSSEWFLIDRWGNIRGRYDWRDPEQIESLFEQAKKLQAEQTPYAYLREPR